MTQSRITRLQEFLEQDPDDQFTNFALALEYLKEGEQQKARSIFLKIIDKDPDYVGVYYHLGKLYEQLGQPEEAVRSYETGINIALKLEDSHSADELQQALQEVENDGEI